MKLTLEVHGDEFTVVEMAKRVSELLYSYGTKPGNGSPIEVNGERIGFYKVEED